MKSAAVCTLIARSMTCFTSSPKLRGRGLSRASTLLIAILWTFPCHSQEFRMYAGASWSPLDNGHMLDQYEGDRSGAPRTVSSASTSPTADRCATAAAAAFSAQATVHTHSLSIARRPGANAGYRDAVLGITNNAALQSLLTPDQSYLDIVLNLRATVETHLVQESFGAVSQTWFDAIAINLLGYSQAEGYHSLRPDGPVLSGVFSGFGPNGGDTHVPLPIRIDLNHLTARVTARVSTTASGSPDGESVIRTWLAPGASVLTLTDGTPLNSLGVDYTFSPSYQVQFDGSPVDNIRQCNSPTAGSSQYDPILPNLVQGDGGGTSFFFSGARSGHWFDPPVANGFEYEMTSDDLFTEVLDFPVGFESEFKIFVGETELPDTFGPGDRLNFSEYEVLLGDSLIGGQGVRSFRIGDILPGVDATSEVAFPIKLAFNADSVDFEMRSLLVPEPASLTLAALGIAGLAGCRKRRALFRRELLSGSLGPKGTLFEKCELPVYAAARILTRTDCDLTRRPRAYRLPR